MRWLLFILLGAIACGGSDPTVEEELPVSCSGKCDGLDSIRSLWDDLRDLDLTDLGARGTTLATDELNDQLSIGGVGITLLEPQAFGSAETAAEEELVDDIDALTQGLLAKFGEGELTTVVNDVRRRHLLSSSDDVFVESGFRVDGSLDHGFHVDADGLADGASVRVGLGSGQVQGRVISATSRDGLTSPRAVVEGVQVARGFVVPRDMSEVRAMKPGEAMSLRGEGTFGLNLGAGVPIVVASPGVVTYNLVVSGALRAQISGELDVQLVRLEGDEVVVDVGTERSTVRSARLAVSDGWGVSGLAETNVSLGPVDVDLGRLLDRALQKRLNSRLNLLSAEAERTGRSSRLSVTRVRFHLDAGGELLEDALSQALRGDLRLAQALSTQGDPAVIVEYDLSRSGLSSVSHAGVDLFGMSFFATTLREEGAVRIATPGGAQELLFDTLHRESGWFFSTHGHGRVALAGLRFDQDGRSVQSEVNLFVEVLEGDEYMERDEMVDRLDALIVAVGGTDALAEVEAHGNALQRLVETTCNPSPAFDPCRTDVLMDPMVVALRADAVQALRDATPSLEADLQGLLVEAAELRVAAQATVEPAASLVGPPTSIVLDYRVDDGGLEAMLGGSDGAAFRDAVVEVLEAVTIDREASESEIADARRGIPSDQAAVLDRMAATFDTFADIYQRHSAVENADIRGLGVIGGRAIAIEVPETGGVVDYEAATARAVVQARSEAVRDLFDALIEDARDLDDVRPELAVGFGLLAMLPSQRADVRMNVDMDLSDRFSQDFTHYREAGQASFDAHGRGGSAELIGGGLFDVEALIDVE